MIEVEIRGPLSAAEAQKFTDYLRKHGRHIETQDREMILLHNYPGYADDPNKREVDIRLRTTNGVSEVMIKRKLREHNVGRSEYAIRIASMEDAKALAKAFGCSRGLWMHRVKDVFKVGETEWSVAEAVSEDGLTRIFYYEAEREALDAVDIEAIHAELIADARARNLRYFSPEEYYEFVNQLGREVNKRIAW